MAKKKSSAKPKIEETQEMYDQNIETVDADKYTKEQVIIFGTNIFKTF